MFTPMPPAFPGLTPSSGILSGKAGAAERYIDFLKAGSSAFTRLRCSRPPGCHLTTPQPVEETFEVLEGLVKSWKR